MQCAVAVCSRSMHSAMFSLAPASWHLLSGTCLMALDLWHLSLALEPRILIPKFPKKQKMRGRVSVSQVWPHRLKYQRLLGAKMQSQHSTTSLEFLLLLLLLGHQMLPWRNPSLSRELDNTRLQAITEHQRGKDQPPSLSLTRSAVRSSSLSHQCTFRGVSSPQRLG